ncbi:MAG: hypothetical protein HKP12_15320 [Gammaproteobacteria bacterium]|nr:hypothetical protein [Gammaproteobacteria bacterium]NNJ98518.1 hypothetical protein [Gammaproteobacteria bacterium]
MASILGFEKSVNVLPTTYVDIPLMFVLPAEAGIQRLESLDPSCRQKSRRPCRWYRSSRGWRLHCGAASGAPVSGYLADQLLVFMAMAGGGRFVTMKPSLHTLTNIAVIEAFMSTRIDQKQISQHGWQLTFVP